MAACVAACFVAFLIIGFLLRPPPVHHYMESDAWPSLVRVRDSVERSVASSLKEPRCAVDLLPKSLGLDAVDRSLASHMLVIPGHDGVYVYMAIEYKHTTMVLVLAPGDEYPGQRSGQFDSEEVFKVLGTDAFNLLMNRRKTYSRWVNWD